MQSVISDPSQTCTRGRLPRIETRVNTETTHGILGIPSRLMTRGCLHSPGRRGPDRPPVRMRGVCPRRGPWYPYRRPDDPVSTGERSLGVRTHEFHEYGYPDETRPDPPPRSPPQRGVEGTDHRTQAWPRGPLRPLRTARPGRILLTGDDGVAHESE